MSELTNKTEVGLFIEKLVSSEGLTYMEAAIQWMDENSIDVSMINKVVPRAIVAKISEEAVKGNMLRPSVIKGYSPQSSLEDFM
ncbi:late-transcription coactivator [Pantoea phage Phynn]|nr:late-transcription coactivator [Pantoea phage Phynn]